MTFDNLDEKLITGIDTRLNINKADLNNEKLQSLGFLSFLEEVQEELNKAVAVFVEMNGHDLEQIKKDHVDLNRLFTSNANYQDFLALFARTKDNIEQLVAAEGPEQLAHQGIVDEVIKLRALIEARYSHPAVTLNKAAAPSQAATPDPATVSYQEPPPNQAAAPHPESVSRPSPTTRPLEFFLGAGILFLPIIFAWFTLRKGYSWLIRLVAFLWLAVFLFTTLPSPKEDIEQDPPAPSVTRAQDADRSSSDNESSEQQQLEQEEKDELHFDPQDLEPQIAR